jgi:hypothetical protein
MTKAPLTEPERLIIADALAFLSLAIAGKCPDRVFELIDRLVVLLALPPPRRWAQLTQAWEPPRRTPRVSDRISEDEIGVCLAWLCATISIFDGRVSYQVMDVTAKLRQVLESLAVDELQGALARIRC